MLIQRSLSSAGFFSCYYWKYEMQLWLWLVSWAPTEPLSGVNTEKIIVINICDEGLSLAVPAYFPSKEILSPVLNFKQNLIELLCFSEVADNRWVTRCWSQSPYHQLYLLFVLAVCISCQVFISLIDSITWLAQHLSSSWM